MSQVLDMSVIEELLALSGDGDPELLLDLISIFLDDGPALLAWERARHTLHTLAVRETAPGLEKARYLRAEPLEGSSGYVIRTCSVDAEADWRGPAGVSNSCWTQ